MTICEFCQKNVYEGTAGAKMQKCQVGAHFYLVLSLGRSPYTDGASVKGSYASRLKKALSRLSMWGENGYHLPMVSLLYRKTLLVYVCAKCAGEGLSEV